MQITIIGLDLAKSVFQVHAVDAEGHVVVRKALRRTQVLPFFARLPSCLVGMEACGTSHHWARELTKLGHEVRLMPPAYVKPYVKRGKHPLPAGLCAEGQDLREEAGDRGCLQARRTADHWQVHQEAGGQHPVQEGIQAGRQELRAHSYRDQGLRCPPKAGARQLRARETGNSDAVR